MTQSIRPSICLNMIVRNEAHIVHEVLDATAPYISSWVIVDTGSTDGTQDIIKKHQANLGIPGELHERPWIDFGHNRTEALNLAQGHADYIWVMDADDTIAGTPDFTDLTADIYFMQFRPENAANTVWWRPQLFRDGFPVRYEGVVHEYLAWAGSPDIRHVNADCYIVFRQRGSRDRGKDRELLRAAIDRNPQDVRSTYHLGRSYLATGEYPDALTWLTRRVELGGADEEEIYLALFDIVTAKVSLNAPWPELRSALMDAWEFRPGRAEPMYFIAAQCRAREQFQAGYHIAKLAAEIPRPQQDTRSVYEDIYAFRAAEEQLACAIALGNYAEAFTLSRNLLARNTIPDQDRERIAHNRDVYAPAAIDAAGQYPATLAQQLRRSKGEPEVLVSLSAGAGTENVERTLNSLLNCCTDLFRAGRFLVLDTGLAAADRARLLDRYGFLEFADTEPPTDTARYRLRLGEGWQLFAVDHLITRTIAILEAESDVARVGINYTDATGLTGASAPEHSVRRAPGTGRYVLTDRPPHGPAMIDTTRIDQPGARYATLDEVLAIATPKPSRYITL